MHLARMLRQPANVHQALPSVRTEHVLQVSSLYSEQPLSISRLINGSLILSISPSKTGLAVNKDKSPTPTISHTNLLTHNFNILIPQAATSLEQPKEVGRLWCLTFELIV